MVNIKNKKIYCIVSPIPKKNIYTPPKLKKISYKYNYKYSDTTGFLSEENFPIMLSGISSYTTGKTFNYFDTQNEK